MSALVTPKDAVAAVRHGEAPTRLFALDVTSVLRSALSCVAVVLASAVTVCRWRGCRGVRRSGL